MEGEYNPVFLQFPAPEWELLGPDPELPELIPEYPKSKHQEPETGGTDHLNAPSTKDPVQIPEYGPITGMAQNIQVRHMPYENKPGSKW